jgi:hypothetical protein
MARKLTTYPVRLSIPELRAELDTYIQARQTAGKADDTTSLDRRKVEYFLTWLESGITAASGLTGT